MRAGNGMPGTPVDPESDEGPDDIVALSRVSAAISGLSDLEAILRIGLDNVLDVMHGAAGGIMLLDEQKQTLSYRVYCHLSDTYAREMHLKLGEGIAGKVAQTGRSTVLEDISLEPSAVRPDLISTEGLKAFLSVPLRAKDNVLGVMNVASHMPRRFTKRDMHLLHSIGDLLGIAIEQAKLYEQLRKGGERYRQLARQVLLTQEEERKRIARELHDETSQSLSGLALNLKALSDAAEMSGIQDTEFKARLEKAHSLAVRISTEVSRLIADLHPTVLDTLGLVPALRWYAETNLDPLGINVTLDTKGMSEALPPDVEPGLFRIAQGAIGNIAKYSEARNVTIKLERKGNELLLSVSDDGKGFNVSEITGIDESGRGRGLFSMKERVRLLGGTCSVDSQPGQGTIVTARVPLIRDIADAEDKDISGR